jgi:hypothetical protein
LYREADHSHPDRHGKIVPKRDDIPAQYHHLLDWYEAEYAPRDIAVRYERFLSSPGVQLVSFGRDAARIFARIRTGRTIRPPGDLFPATPYNSPARPPPAPISSSPTMRG